MLTITSFSCGLQEKLSSASLRNWNVGILGSGEMKKWAIGEIPLDMELKMSTNEQIPY